MKYIVAVVVWVLEAIEDSPLELILFGWIAGSIAGVGLLQGWKIYSAGFWGYALGIACAFAGWVVSWLCGQGVKLIYRYHRPDSPLLRRKRKNACPACGYDRTGLPQSSTGPAPCPECGKG